MNTSKITNVLIFKDGFYWLTIKMDKEEGYYDFIGDVYRIIPESWELKNGFEFASDAYAYIASLQSKQEPEYNPKEEERLKEIGETSG